MQFLKRIWQKLRGKIKLTHFVGIMSILTFALYHIPFFKFVFEHVDYKSFNGVIIIVSLVVIMLVLNALLYYLIFYISRITGKVLLSITLICNAIALYFINTFGIVVDEAMISNLINTNYDEASNFFSVGMVLYTLIFGILPSLYVCQAKIVKESWKPFIKRLSIGLAFILIVIFANASNWLWIDKYSRQLGGLAMPWSYSVNIPRFYIHKYQENRKEIPLPDATIKDDEKAVVVLVIGESARSMNFSLYGYQKNTNPLLSQTEGVFHFPATSCATYTTAALKCILEHENTGKLYEILPNYLYRNGVDVVWRSTNWGEPPLHIEKVQRSDYLNQLCQGEQCNYDEILLTGLKEQILSSDKSKTLIVLHTSTSHGPNYSKRYPPEFEVFKPVCHSVELSQCSTEELINAYDNTIVYTDYLLRQIIEMLREMPEYRSTMMFVSDHGESLGEKNLYMHGVVPMSIAPREQYEIPFIVWVSQGYKTLKPMEHLDHSYVFHSVMNFLSVESPIYKEDMNIFQ